MLARINSARVVPVLVLALLLALVVTLAPSFVKGSGLVEGAPAPVQEVVNAAAPDAAAGTSVTVCNSYKSVRSFRAYRDSVSYLVAPGYCRSFATKIYIFGGYHARSGGSCVNGYNFRTLATGSATEWNVQPGSC